MTDPQTELARRRLGLLPLTAVVVGEVIAVGIFLTPAGMAATLASPFWLILVWCIMGAMAVCGALTFGELAARFPHTGGLYIYLREAFGPAVGFLYGWMSLLVLDPGITAALALGMASYAGYLLELPPEKHRILAVSVVLITGAANALHSRISSLLAQSLTTVKLGLILFIVVWGLSLGLGDWSNFSPFVARREPSPPFAAALAGALVAGFFSFGGWWDTSKLAGEAKDPDRNLPRALVLGVTTVTVVYIAISMTFLYLVPLRETSSDSAFAALVGERLFGALGGSVFALIVTVSVASSLAGLMFAAPRVYAAMAADGLFLRRLSSFNRRTGTPIGPILIQTALACVMVAWSGFADIIGYFIFVAVAFIGLTAGSLFVLRRKHGLPAGYRTPGYPLTPLVFLAMVGGMLILLFMSNPVRSLAGILVVLLGWPVYRAVIRRDRPVLTAINDGRVSGT